MLLFLYMLFGATILCNGAEKITSNPFITVGGCLSTGDPQNLPMDYYQVHSGANETILKLATYSCDPYNTCTKTLAANSMYLEMGCTPSKSMNKFCCPVSYDCGKAFSSRSKTQCQYKGKTYAVGAKLPDDPDLPCVTNITCAMKAKVPGFTYTRKTCPTVKTNAKTIQLYSYSSCCSTGTRSSVLSAKEFKCVYNNVSYPIGALIPSPTHCQICICLKGFNGTLSAPWCKFPKCGYELDAHNNIIKGYAPVYGYGFCCPFMWEKPSAADVLMANPIDNRGVSKAVCTFGSKKIKYGDGLISTVASTSCTLCGCLIAPSVACGLLSDCSAAVAYLLTHAGM